MRLRAFLIVAPLIAFVLTMGFTGNIDSPWMLFPMLVIEAFTFAALFKWGWD